MTSLNLHPVHAFGMTETYGPVIMSYYLPEWDSLPAEQRYAKMARQGHGVITGLPARVIMTDQGSALIDVARNGKEIGEIILKGNLSTKGYYKDLKATEKLFEGGWMHSGDLAVWHDDGAIQIMDRAKDIIISGKFVFHQWWILESANRSIQTGGENISSIAVENILCKHPSVVEAAVVGLPHAEWGEVPKAFITRTPGSMTEGQEILRWAKESSDMGRFMVPRDIEIIDELPKTSTGKVQKKVLRELEEKRRKTRANL
jgi:acyl-CoA synthetase (AMP-forming)/AMP-acid ligase II